MLMKPFFYEPTKHRPIFYEPARHLYKLITDPEYRTWCLLDARLGGIERFKDCRTNVYDWDIILPDAASFLSTYREIFVNKIYQFKASSSQPSILDLGANIGLSVLFFKKIYPEAKITAFEADPNIFRFLQNNVFGNGFNDVELINKAVWNENCVLKFHAEGADGGRIAENGDEKLIEIEAIDIRDHLKDHQYEFLKMDIEGAEDIVFLALNGYLSGFKYIFLEYHSRADQKQRLAEILELMVHEGFRVDIHNIMSHSQPFIKPQVLSGFDLQLNIFAWKE